MKKNQLILWYSFFIRSIEYVLPIGVLVLLLLFTYVKFFGHPYLGFRLDSSGQVIRIYSEQNEHPTLLLGDRLIQVGSTTWLEFQTDLTKPFFSEVRPGNRANLLVERGNQLINIFWTFPGPNPLEISDLLINEGWLVFVFWLTGTLVLLTLRPKDELWGLMVAFNYLTAIWVACGSGLSFYHIWGSAIILRITIWFCVPVYLHLHWVYPKPFKIRLPFFMRLIYIAALVFSIAELFEMLPRTFYLLGFLVASGGSIFLLILHAIFQPETRRDLRWLLVATFLSLTPAIFVALLGIFATFPLLAGAGTLGLPFLPMLYFYAAYRRRLGVSELRVNRLIIIYLFFIFLLLVFLPLLILLNFNAASITIGIASALLTTFIYTFGFPYFQVFIEKHLFGIRLAPKHLQEIYSNRITTSTSFESLRVLIEEEILPSLLVRQFAFLRFDQHGTSKVFFTSGISEEEIPSQADVPELMTNIGTYRNVTLLINKNQSNYWVRLVLPLKVDNQLIGLWLFGRRDPDDMYSQVEIPILQSLANQTAIAQSNIQQAERVKALYLSNVARHEEERLRLARELHDDVLAQLAALSLDIPPSPHFQESYQRLTRQIRGIVSNLRPPMLDYGLKLAIEELLESIAERNQGTTNITMRIDKDRESYPPNVVQHIFRIVQEACSNAIRHAHAKNVDVSGDLSANNINITISDDGTGFDTAEGLNLENLLMNKHFGLAGMMERAELIGAHITIDSNPNAGTKIYLIWNS